MEDGDRYGREIGLLDLTPDELWLYAQQCCGYTNIITGTQKKPKILTPSGSFKIFNSFINDPANGVKIVVRENEEHQPEYVLQAKNEAPDRPRKDDRVRDRQTYVVESENVIVSETGAHPSNRTYLATTKLLIQNYTEHPQTEEGELNLRTIRNLQRQRRSEALMNGAVLPPLNTSTLTTVSVLHLPQPEIELCGHLSNLYLISPELIELSFIRLHANGPPPCIEKPDSTETRQRERERQMVQQNWQNGRISTGFWMREMDFCAYARRHPP